MRIFCLMVGISRRRQKLTGSGSVPAPGQRNVQAAQIGDLGIRFAVAAPEALGASSRCRDLAAQKPKSAGSAALPDWRRAGADLLSASRLADSSQRTPAAAPATSALVQRALRARTLGFTVDSEACTRLAMVSASCSAALQRQGWGQFLESGC